MLYLRNPDDDAVRGLVRELIDRSGNVSELARRLGMNRTTLYGWTRGASRPDFQELASLAAAVGISLRVELGSEVGMERHEDLTVMVGRVISNQQRQIEMLERLLMHFGLGAGQ